MTQKGLNLTDKRKSCKYIIFALQSEDDIPRVRNPDLCTSYVSFGLVHFRSEGQKYTRLQMKILGHHPAYHCSGQAYHQV